MFEAKLLNGLKFKKIIDSLRDLVEDANFDCSSSGINVHTMDKLNGALICLTLDNNGFDHYRCDRNISLGINMKYLNSVLKCAHDDDIITMKSADQGDTLNIHIETSSQKKTSDFEIKLKVLEQDYLIVPARTFQTKIELPSTDFQKISKDLSSIGDTIAVHTSKEAVRFSTEGDRGFAGVTLKNSIDGEITEQPQREKVTINASEPVDILIGARYLNLFAKATQLCSYITIYLGNDQPVEFEYMIEGLGKLQLFLAPKLYDPCFHD